MTERLGWDEYFMSIARVVASRSTCDRRRVGAVLVRDRMLLSTGYNGSIRGLPHCDEVGHQLEGDHCVATIHAEANAIVQAARNGIRIDGSTLYVTASPCWNCFKMLANSGVRRIVYDEFYRDERVMEVASSLGIQISEHER
jgi:dCMP deaminase